MAKKVLLVQVEPQIADALRSQGHEVVVADDQIEAAKWLKEETFDQILTSLELEPTKLDQVICESAPMKEILSQVAKIARSGASVFITGESGTGKEVIARQIHEQSPRKSKPYIRVNCAAIPDTLIDSEFFGHEKGAFTGASAKRLGRFELAHGGTLLLDEVTEIPANLQPKLMRALQEQEFERVGGTKPVQVDVRIIATSNRNIEEALADKILRHDLFYRLNVIPVHLPPLRERPEDIIPLAEYFIGRLAKKKRTLTDCAKKALESYSWPGNIRELANVIERTLVLSTHAEISTGSFDIALGNGARASATSHP